jgi:hypothetical protein
VVFLPVEVVVLARFWRLGVVLVLVVSLFVLVLMVVAVGFGFPFLFRCCSGVVGGCFVLRSLRCFGDKVGAWWLSVVAVCSV